MKPSGPQSQLDGTTAEHPDRIAPTSRTVVHLERWQSCLVPGCDRAPLPVDRPLPATNEHPSERTPRVFGYCHCECETAAASKSPVDGDVPATVVRPNLGSGTRCGAGGAPGALSDVEDALGEGPGPTDEAGQHFCRLGPSHSPAPTRPSETGKAGADEADAPWGGPSVHEGATPYKALSSSPAFWATQSKN